MLLVYVIVSYVIVMLLVYVALKKLCFYFTMTIHTFITVNTNITDLKTLKNIKARPKFYFLIWKLLYCGYRDDLHYLIF